MNWESIPVKPESGCVLYYPIRYPTERSAELAELVERSHLSQQNHGSVDLWVRSEETESQVLRQLMLPHVAQHILPDSFTQGAVCLHWELSEEIYPKVRKARWFIQRSDGRQIGLRIQTVRFVFFSSGISFLELQVGLEAKTLGEWIEGLVALRTHSDEQVVTTDASDPFLSSLFKQLDLSDGIAHSLLEIFRALLPEGEDLYIQDNFIPFAYIFADTDWLDKSQLYEVLYRLRNFFPPSQEAFPPERGALSLKPFLLQYATRAWFVGSLEGTCFLSLNPSPNFTAHVHRSMRTVYPLIFRIVLLQHFYLVNLSQNVLKNWLQVGGYREQVKMFRKIIRDYLHFLSTQFIPQIFQRERHHKVYLFWQKAMEIPRLYARVNRTLQEVYEYTEEENLRHLSRLVNAFGVLIGFPSLAFAVLSVNILGFTAREEGIPLEIVLIILIISIIAGFILMISWMTLPNLMNRLRRLYNPMRFRSHSIFKK